LLARATNTSEGNVREWINSADLFRVRGIGREYSMLLNSAGVKTVVQLSRRNPENLQLKLEDINKNKRIVQQVPSTNTVREWVRHAKSLKRKVEY
jgi:hypothetical protein